MDILRAIDGQLIRTPSGELAICGESNPCSDWIYPPINNPVAVVSVAPIDPDWAFWCNKIFVGPSRGFYYGDGSYCKSCFWAWDVGQISYYSNMLFVQYFEGDINQGPCWMAMMTYQNGSQWSGFGQWRDPPKSNYELGCAKYQGELCGRNRLGMLTLPPGAMQISNGKLSGSFTLPNIDNYCCARSGSVATITISQA
ncbi:MAG: hypothetical protein HZA50_14770 [Planctomycetes bacterium]|nr:hypothetical protein [Planctomycetota bacterium]